MKVILLQDVAKIGRRHSIVDVPDGYGMNKLIPKHLAKLATPANIKQVLSDKAQLEAVNSATEADWYQVYKDLSEAEVIVKTKTNPEGKLFEALKPALVVEAMKAYTEAQLDASWIVITEPIKSIGEHTLQFKLADNNKTLTIKVESI